MKRIYADYAATTPTDPKVLAAMKPYFGDKFGNPSSGHFFGTEARKAVEEVKNVIANFLNCQSNEIYFTSCGSESNNLAILGVARANRSKGNHIITSNIEHPSVRNTCLALEKDSFQVTYLPVDNNGLISAQSFEKAIDKNTILASFHLANSEIGVIQNIKELTRIAHKNKIIFHTDACQAAALIDLDVKRVDVDLLSFNGSKIYGSKGVAVLYVKDGISIWPIIYGGGQQQSLRSGTENVPGIVGLAKATELVQKNRSQDFQRIKLLRNHLQQILQKNKYLTINVVQSERLPNHLSVTVSNYTGNSIVASLDEMGLAVSAGSACSTNEISSSHVLTAIGLDSIASNATIRISLGRNNTKDEIVRIAEILTEVSKKV